jgi:hypothetical protein
MLSSEVEIFIFRICVGDGKSKKTEGAIFRLKYLQNMMNLIIVKIYNSLE